MLRSDEIRKQLSGVHRLVRLGAAGYSEETSRRVYTVLADRAAQVLGSGHSVVLDAVFLDPRDRHEAEAVARAAGVRFQGVWLDAPAEVLVSRVAHRANDPSDADPSVVRAQLQRDPGPIGWTRVPAESGAEGVAGAVAELVSRAARPE